MSDETTTDVTLPPELPHDASDIEQSSHVVAPSAMFRKSKSHLSRNWHTTLAKALAFEQLLRDLRDQNRGAMATLRRDAGRTLAEAKPQSLSWFYPRFHAAERHEEIYFLVATLFDFNRKGNEKGSFSEDFGTTMRLIALKPLEGKPRDSKKEDLALESFRRFPILLDAKFGEIHDAQDGFKKGGGELAFRLRQMVKLAASKEIGINWAVLLADLTCWDMPGKPVQKNGRATFTRLAWNHPARNNLARTNRVLDSLKNHSQTMCKKAIDAHFNFKGKTYVDRISRFAEPRAEQPQPR